MLAAVAGANNRLYDCKKTRSVSSSVYLRLFCHAPCSSALACVMVTIFTPALVPLPCLAILVLVAAVSELCAFDC